MTLGLALFPPRMPLPAWTSGIAVSEVVLVKDRAARVGIAFSQFHLECALCYEVQPGSAAARTEGRAEQCVAPYDVVVAVNGRPVEGAVHAVTTIREAPPGKPRVSGSPKPPLPLAQSSDCRSLSSSSPPRRTPPPSDPRAPSARARCLVGAASRAHRIRRVLHPWTSILFATLRIASTCMLYLYLPVYLHKK